METLGILFLAIALILYINLLTVKREYKRKGKREIQRHKEYIDFMTMQTLVNNMTDEEIEKKFKSCTSFNGDLTSWDVSDIESFSDLFKNCQDNNKK